MLVLCNFLRKLMVSDKKIHRSFRTHTTLDKQNPLENFLIFTIYQNYTLALSSSTLSNNVDNSDFHRTMIIQYFHCLNQLYPFQNVQRSIQTDFLKCMHVCCLIRSLWSENQTISIVDFFPLFCQNDAV